MELTIVHTTGEGISIPIHRMEEKHLVNTCRMFLRKALHMKQLASQLDEDTNKDEFMKGFMKQSATPAIVSARHAGREAADLYKRALSYAAEMAFRGIIDQDVTNMRKELLGEIVQLPSAKISLSLEPNLDDIA